MTGRMTGDSRPSSGEARAMANRAFQNEATYYRLQLHCEPSDVPPYTVGTTPCSTPSGGRMAPKAGLFLVSVWLVLACTCRLGPSCFSTTHISSLLFLPFLALGGKGPILSLSFVSVDRGTRRPRWPVLHSFHCFHSLLGSMMCSFFLLDLFEACTFSHQFP